MPTQWSEAEQVPLGCIAPHTAPAVSFRASDRRHWRGNPFPFSHASGGLFSFSSERKEEKKRRQKLRFWISLRGFTWFLLCLFLPRERCAMQIPPKCCIVSASLFAAAFALKCKAVQFYTWCVGAGFYAVERSGTSALGVPRPPFLHYVSGGAEPRPYEPFRQQQFFQTSGQRPPPTFAALRQRRDLIIAPPGGCFQRGRARTDRKPSERKIV